MKYLLYFFVFTIPVLSISQDNEAEKIVYGNPFIKGNQDFINMLNRKNASKDATSQFLFKNWQKMKVIGIEEDYFFSVDSANFHIPTSQVIFYNKGKILKVFEEQVKEVRIKNIIIKAFPVEKKNVIVSEFFEVLYEGKACLLRRYELVKKKINSNPMGIGDRGRVEIRKKERLFYYMKGNEVKSLPKSKRKFLKIFKSNNKRIKKYAKKSKLSLNTTSDIIQIFNFYNIISTSEK